MRALLVCLVVVGLAGCAGSTTYSGNTVAQLEVVELDSQPQVLSVTPEETIAAYRALLDFPTANPFRPAAMHRLADLLLDYGEEREVSSADKIEITEIDEYADAITIYEELLATYPGYHLADQVLYQLARGYDKQGNVDKTMALLARLVANYPDSEHNSEAWFRLGELNFLYANYQEAAQAYAAIIDFGDSNTFYEHSLLKYGWALFKQEQYDLALQAFFSLVAYKLEGTEFDPIEGTPFGLGKADVEIVNDTLRGMALVFALKGNRQQMDEFARVQGDSDYNHLVYQAVAALYHSEERYLDEGRAYGAYIQAYPQSRYSPLFQLKLVDSYRFARETASLNQAKAEFVTDYWRRTVPEQAVSAGYQVHLDSFAKQYLHDLSEYYHARYQKRRGDADYESAVHWYQLYLANFGTESDAVEKHFLLAELFFEKKNFEAAGYEYERVAYFYPPHQNAAEAGYGAVLSYQKLLEGAGQSSPEAWRELLRQSALRFVSTFPQDKRVPNTVVTLANQDYERGDLDNARLMAELLLNGEQTLDDESSFATWMLLGHIAQHQQDYLRADQSFQKAREFAGNGTKQAREAQQWQAISIYKQAESVLARDDKRAAVGLFLRVPATAPGSQLAAQAQYDAAATLISLEEWQQAADLLVTFQQTYPKHELQPEVPAKLAFVYMSLGRSAAAAEAYAQIAARDSDREVKQAALLQAAQLYHQADNPAKAVSSYKRYLKKYPDLSAQSFQVRSQLALIYAQLGQIDKRNYWLKNIIKKAEAPEVKQDDSIQYQAAQSSFTLAEDSYAEFASIELVEPIKRNLASKKRKMEAALADYQKSGSYGFAEYVTAATHRIGEMYFRLSQALLDSARPGNLDEEELEQYEILLEEQAYPFEEKAIEILQLNIARIGEGVYNDWTDRSLATLAELLPVQYAKQERPSEVINALH